MAAFVTETDGKWKRQQQNKLKKKTKKEWNSVMNSHGGRNEFIVFIVAQFPIPRLSPAPTVAHSKVMSPLPRAHKWSVTPRTVKCRSGGGAKRILCSQRMACEREVLETEKPFADWGKDDLIEVARLWRIQKLINAFLECSDVAIGFLFKINGLLHYFIYLYMVYNKPTLKIIKAMRF